MIIIYKDLFDNIKLDKNSSVSLYQQLGDSIYELWEKGALVANTKLPPIRKLSSMLDVNNVTVVNAYKYLESKKIAYSITGSGTYISELSPNYKPIIAEAFLPKEKMFNNIGTNEDIINFAKGSTSTELFPVEEFKTIFNEILDRDKGSAFGYEEIQGFKPLRESICNYVKDIGINTVSDKVQIISGAQQGIDIIAKAILSFGDYVLVESPTYYGACGAFLSRGAKVIEVPLEKDGMDISKLIALIKLYKPKIVYVMPYFQTPTSINTSLDKKRKLIELASKFDFYLIEEDNQCEFNFTDELIIPIKALDYKNKVIYIKSLSKILMPGLRIGFMILPKAVLERVLSAKYTTDIETSGFIQRGFELFLSSVNWKLHLKKMRDIYFSRFCIMKEYSKKYLKDKLDYIEPSGGLNFCYFLKDNTESKNIVEKLLTEKVIVYPGSVYSINKQDLPFIRLSFANVEEDKIIEGLKRIAVCL